MKRKNLTKKVEKIPQPTSPLEKYKQENINLFVREMAGEEGLRIVSCIGCNEVTDEKIEQTTKMKIAEIRSILNHLHSYGLVEYKREKNLQTGWFTYTWKLNTNRALQNFIVIKKREYDSLKEKMQHGDSAQVYRCQKHCSCLEFEKAVERSFRCPNCNGKLNVVNQEEELKKLEERINLLTSMATSSEPEPTLNTKPHALSDKLTHFNK